MGVSARREVGDSPAEDEEDQGVCRSDSWQMQKQADGSGTHTSPRRAPEQPFFFVLRTACCALRVRKPMRRVLDDCHTHE